MAITITNTGADTFISDGSQVPNFNKNFIAGLSKATAISNPLTGGLDSILVLDNTGRSIVMAYSDITDINGDTTAALGLTNATEVATYLNNNFFNLAGGGGGGSLPAGTADKNNLQWNATLAKWEDNPNVKFGYQNSDLSGYITGTYGTFDYGDGGYAWRWKSYPNADDTPIDNHVIADNFIYTNHYNSRQRRNVELLNVPTPEVIGTNFPPLAASSNEWFAEVNDYNLSERTVSAPSIYARNSITPNTIIDEVNGGSGEVTNVIQNKDAVQTTIPLYAFDHTIGFNGVDVVWSVEGSDGVNTFDAIITPNEVSMRILSNAGGLSCTGDLAMLVPTNVGGLYLGSSTITGSGSHSLVYGSYIYVQGILSDSNAVTAPAATNASMLIATGSSIGIDPGTTVQPYNSVALGGLGQLLKVSNTAYASGMATRSVTTDAGGSGYTLDMDNDPINLIVMDVTALDDSFFIPAASDKFLDLEIIVKKIGSNNLTIDDGGNGTVEQIGGGWGSKYTMAGTNSAVTIKCILLGVNYYWVVY